LIPFASESNLPDTTMEDVEVIICSLLETAFEFCITDKGTKDIYDSWEDMNYYEIVEKKQRDHKLTMLELLKSMNIDIDDLDINDPESEVFIKEKLRQAREQYEQRASEAQAQKKKSKKQLGAAYLSDAKDELKNKSLRSVYLTLAKVLHPDTETDDNLKAEKEELMKQVAKAYEEKDLITLLLIESNWFQNVGNNLSSISEDAAAMYILRLKDQAKSLRQDKATLKYQPRFKAVHGISGLKESVGLAYLSNELAKISKNIRLLKRDINYIETEKRSDIKKYIKVMAKRYDVDPFVDIFINRYFS
jgi:hypothetical protein